MVHRVDRISGREIPFATKQGMPFHDSEDPAVCLLGENVASGLMAGGALGGVFGAACRLIPGYNEDWIRTPFYGHEMVSQSVSTVLFAGLCVYFWWRSLGHKEEAES